MIFLDFMILPFSYFINLYLFFDPYHREPLIRKEIVSIVEGLNELRSDGLKNIGITTNGVAFTERRANRLKAAGLDTANISLDTLEAMKAEFITRRPMEYHKAVLASIDHSLAAGITTKVSQ